MSDFDAQKSRCEELYDQEQKNPIKALENNDKVIIIKGLRYLREARKLSYNKIGDFLGLSYARVCELRFDKKFPTSQKRLSKIRTNLEEAIKQVKQKNGTKSM
jgi:hypothetical protein